MNGRTWIIIGLFVVMSLSAAVLNMEAADGQTPFSVDLVINGNGELMNSTYVSGGPGTDARPYIISDLDFGGGSLDIRNITSSLAIRNITFDSGVDTAIHMYNTRTVVLNNISYTGREVFMHLRSVMRPTIQNCNIRNVPDQSYFLKGDSLIQPTIRNNNLSSEGLSLIEFDNMGGGLQISSNVFSGMCITDKFFYMFDKISDNRFIDSYINVENGTNAGEIKGNTFESSKYNGINSYHCDDLEVRENTFRTKNGIHFRSGYHTYRSIIEGNNFTECDVGIRFSSGTLYNRFISCEITGNSFRNCTSYAADIDLPMFIEISGNRFVDNAGKRGDEAGSQVRFMYDSTGNLLTVDDIGNYWSNHRSPDEDCNGIVDDPYEIGFFSKDERPFSNIYFDTDEPEVNLHPLGDDQNDRSYVHFTWNVSDEGTGIVRAELSVDGYIHDVTDLSEFPVSLAKGNHHVRLSGWDMAGIGNVSEYDLNIADEIPVIKFKGIVDGGYVRKSQMRSAWNIVDYFEPTEQVLFLNGERIELPSGSRSHDLHLVPGWNLIKLEVRDGYVSEVNESMSVYLDDDAPSIRIISPVDGSYLSNRIVNVRWEMGDNVDLFSAGFRLDDNDWQDSLHVRKISAMMDKGEHTILLRCSDRAGNTVTESSTFHVAEDPDLAIISPADGEVTSTPILRLEWEYSGKMPWSNAVVLMDSGDSYDMAQVRKMDIPFEDLDDGYRDGEKAITLRLMDGHDNYIEKTISIVLDREGPMILLDDGSDADHISDPQHVFSWKGFDETGIDHYELSVDSGEWIDMGMETSYTSSISDGDHTLSIAAYDVAGNTRRLDHSFILDSTAPEITFSSPDDMTYISDPLVRIQWELTDRSEIVESMMVIDGDRTENVMDRNSMEVVFRDDGDHHLELRAVDLMGNRASGSMTFILDITSPAMSWNAIPDGYVNTDNTRLEWEVYDAVGISEQYMDIDGEREELEMDVRYLDLDLPDGEHIVRIHAVDHAGHGSTIETSVAFDTSAPYIDLDEIARETGNGPGSFEWMIEDGVSGTSSVDIRVDDGEWKEVVADDSYSLDRLSPGDHTLYIRAADNAGNTAEESLTFTIEEVDEDDPSNGNIMLAAGLILTAVVLIMISAAGAVFLVKRKGDSECENKVSVPKTPDRISLPDISRLTPTVSEMRPALPASGKRVFEATTGTGYIRPSKIDQKPTVKHENTLDTEGRRIH